MVLVLVLALFAFTACNNASAEVGEELVVNSDFSEFSSSNKFEGWTTSSSSMTFGQSTASDDEGNKYLYIDNSTAGYNYLKQSVKVDTNKIYKVTVKVSVKSELSNKSGAYLTFLENTDYKFAKHTESTKGFETTTVYIKPKNTDYLTIALCVGSEDANCKGKAYFDDVSVQRVDEVPDGYEVIDFRKAKTVNTNENASGICFVVLLTLFSVAILVGAYVLIKRVYARRDAFADFGASVVYDKKAPAQAKWYQNNAFIVAVIMLGAFLLRLVLLLTTYGMGNETTSTINVAKQYLGVNNGVFNFFENMEKLGRTVTYSPGEIYILSILGFATKGLNYEQSSIIFRLINVIADVAVVGMIYGYGQKHVGNKLATIYSAVYALLPFSLIMSGMNGSFEALLIALVIASLILMLDKKYLATYFVMTLASVLDIRAMAVAPIVVAYFVYMYIRDNDDIKKFTAHRAQIVFGLVGCFVLAYALTIPVAIHQIGNGDAFFGFKVIMREISNTTYFVQNAFNLYGMVGMNNKSSQESVNILNLIFLLVLEAYVISCYFKNRNKQELLLLASFTLAVVAVFTIKVTYTYLFLSLALALMYTMVSGDKRMYFVSGGIATLGFINFAQLLNQSGFIKSGVVSNAITNFETTSAFYITFSVFAVLLIGYYAYVTYSITNNTKIVDIKAMPLSVGDSLKASFKNLKSKLKKEEN